MNKEDILKMSRKENIGKVDERELQISANASKVGMTLGATLSVIIVIISRIIDEPLLGLSAWSVYFTMHAGQHLYRYAKIRRKTMLIQSIIAIIFALACFACMIILIIGMQNK